MHRHIDYCTHITFDEDRDILTRPSFDVNMRLFADSEQYRKLVLDICSYLRWCVFTRKAGYPDVAGYSGAIAGIPFNIVVARNGDSLLTMLNPQILVHSDEIIRVFTNCGALTLEDPVLVDRYAWIVVEYYNEAGVCIVDQFDMRTGFVIQHQLDHNNGKLIRST